MENKYFFAIVALVFMWLVLHSVRKKRFFEKYSFYWFMLACALFLLSLFPNVIKQLSIWVNIQYAPSFLFLVAIIFILGIVFYLTQNISLLKEQNKDLAQTVSVLEIRIKEIEEDEIQKELVIDKAEKEVAAEKDYV